MDALEALMTRRSVRAYTDEPVSDDQVRKILAAGMQAPSAGRRSTPHRPSASARIGSTQSSGDRTLIEMRRPTQTCGICWFMIDEVGCAWWTDTTRGRRWRPQGGIWARCGRCRWKSCGSPMSRMCDAGSRRNTGARIGLFGAIIGADLSLFQRNDVDAWPVACVEDDPQCSREGTWAHGLPRLRSANSARYGP